MGSQEAADLSTLFDIGGIFGGILAGLLSDLTGMSAFTCAGYFILTIPSVRQSRFNFTIILKYLVKKFNLFLDDIAALYLSRIRECQRRLEHFLAILGRIPRKWPLRVNYHGRFC